MTDSDIREQFNEIRMDIQYCQQKIVNLIKEFGKVQEDLKKIKGQLEALQYHQHDKDGIVFDTRYVK